VVAAAAAGAAALDPIQLGSFNRQLQKVESRITELRAMDSCPAYARLDATTAECEAP
jgi:hypothetical protein